MSSYTKGINGIDVDFLGPGHAQFDLAGEHLERFHVPDGQQQFSEPLDHGSQPDQRFLRPAPGPAQDRVELVWADNAIKETWLEVIVKATADTGLGQIAGDPAGYGDVFFFGNAAGDDFVGETTVAFTNSTDDLDVRNHPGAAVPITNIYDYTKDGFVNSSDSIAAQIVGSIKFIMSATRALAPFGTSRALPRQRRLPSHRPRWPCPWFQRMPSALVASAITIGGSTSSPARATPSTIAGRVSIPLPGGV